MLPDRNVGIRRQLLCGAAATTLVAASRRLWAQGFRPVPLSIGTTPVFLDDQLGLLRRWKAQLEEATGSEITFVQRGSYREITELLLNEQVDAAWVCGPPYVMNAARLKLMAVPVYQGKPLYRSYLIVPRADTKTQSITDLRGKVFAFSDPQSNSGYLVPLCEMIRAHERPDTLFRKSFFTYAHRKVIDAVAVGLADGGEVDGYVWDTLAKQNPELTGRTRIAWRSREHGFPPIVARPSLPASTFALLQQAFTGMRDTPRGREMLTELNLDGFITGSDDLFGSIRELVRIAALVPA